MTPVTVAVKVQTVVPDVMLSPANTAVVLVKLVVAPLQPGPVTALIAVTLTPAGKVSVKPRLV